MPRDKFTLALYVRSRQRLGIRGAYIICVYTNAEQGCRVGCTFHEALSVFRLIDIKYKTPARSQQCAAAAGRWRWRRRPRRYAQLVRNARAGADCFLRMCAESLLLRVAVLSFARNGGLEVDRCICWVRGSVALEKSVSMWRDERREIRAALVTRQGRSEN